MDKKQQQEIILDYLEYAYSGAKMMDDEETKLRIVRAIAAFKADVNENIFKEDIINRYWNIRRKICIIWEILRTITNIIAV